MVRKFTLIFLLALSLGITACYDGWDYPGDPGGPGSPPPLPPTLPKPVYLILFETISLSTAAVGDSSCFGATGTEAYRLAEWSERITAAKNFLETIAESVRVLPRTIEASDCAALSAVEAAANDQDPLGIIDSLTIDANNRPAVHLKAVFWDTDVSGAFTGVVETPHWAAWRKIRNRGINAVSLHYFSVSNPITGHWSHWKSAIDSNLVSLSTPLNTVDPTDQGRILRIETAASDAEALASWVLEKALGLGGP